ncbi:bifunctional tRNA pseudouridine(32) synthase/23S rRNA pseudouridine(746) synthase RluA [Photobacterium jeanii]|uniref:bifunctional tRNA pseudouridine(32) synthase/23S rRNA pseudouridine(746) synthase RluA n=1 Tax=Photobacterium jeanii TaxID=858640 RepID=UPI0008375A9B|nr:bifunctional tRNA pseudouridine(32) synthase/23S rRNA pseudouridine(746) synthase RluA [Photobacterium jeanii]PST87669.1 bifunctional tRNA pseudouridine(32) synthase/23S rRNA pseudouridine(746) synthase RluA [Photobacterium jeanii]
MKPLPVLEYNPPMEPWLDVLYQDDDFIALNKPSGLLSNPGRHPEHHDSIYSRVRQAHSDSHIVHRLDMATSGLIIMALNKEAERDLHFQFRERLTHKVYYARVWGHVEQDQGSVDLPLICDWENRPRQKICHVHGKPSLTHYQVVRRDADNTSLVRLLPITGRSHQLRLHMMALGHPIVGDEFYANEEAKALSPRLALHAAELCLYHPTTNDPVHLFAPCEFYPEAPQQTLPLNPPRPQEPAKQSRRARRAEKRKAHEALVARAMAARQQAESDSE